MEELTAEQKAKAYDEAIEKFGVILNLNTVKESGTIFSDDVRKIFPELKESEDERIRKALIEYYSFDKEGCSHALDNITPEQIIDWLKKQGEQKPTELSEEDENGLGDALWAIKQARIIAKDENDMGTLWNAERWLKSIKDRIQSKQSNKPQGKSALEAIKDELKKHKEL